jgi:hypothetical protein
MAPPDPGEKKATEALVAIRAMGVNSLPFLMRKLKRPEPHQGLDGLGRRYLAKLPYVRQLLPTRHQVFVERQQAVTGLVVLCPLPPHTVLELRKLSCDFQSPSWALADDIVRANDNPRLRDMALSSYFVDKAAIERLRRVAASGPSKNGPSLFGPPKEPPPEPIHETLGLTNGLWGNH